MQEENNNYTLRAVCFCGIIKWIEVVKKDDGSVTYTEFLKSAIDAFKIDAKMEDLILQDEKFYGISEHIFNKYFASKADTAFNVCFIPKALVQEASMYAQRQATANSATADYLRKLMSDDTEPLDEIINFEKTLDAIDADGDVIMSNAMDLGTDQHGFIPPINIHKPSTQVTQVVSNKDCSTDSPDKIKIDIEALLNDFPVEFNAIKEEHEKLFLSEKNWHLMVRLVVAGIQKLFGKSPKKDVLTATAEAIVKYFPYLNDPHSQLGYESFYNPHGPRDKKGALVNRIKRVNSGKPNKKDETKDQSTNEKWQFFPNYDGLTLEGKMATFNGLNKTSDGKLIRKMMTETFQFRRSLNLALLTKFPRFLDIPFLLDVDFELMFPETEGLNFIPDGIKELALQRLCPLAKKSLRNFEDWNDDIYAIIALLHLLPSKKKKKWPNFQEVVDSLVLFNQNGKPKEELKITAEQFCLVAVGETKKSIVEYFVLVDSDYLPTTATNGREALRKLFQAYWVFNAEYEPYLKEFFEFIESYFFKMSSDIRFGTQAREIQIQLNKINKD